MHITDGVCRQKVKRQKKQLLKKKKWREYKYRTQQSDLVLVVGFAVRQVTQRSAGGTMNVHFWVT